MDQLKLESVLPGMVINVLVFGGRHCRAHVVHHHEWHIERKSDQEEAARKAEVMAGDRYSRPD